MSEEEVESILADFWRRRNRIRPKSLADNDWAKGRDQFLIFLIRVRDEKVIQKIIEIQNKLSTIPCFDPFPKDYFHITVKGCGFLVESEEHEDDILIENLPKIVSRAKEVFQTFHGFNVVLSRLNILPDVVLIEVHDEGKIGELNKELQAIPEIRKMKFDYPNFLPHTSIGHFRNDREFNGLIRYLEKLRETKFGELTVGYVELVNVNLSERYPLLKTTHAFRLRQQPYQQS